MQTDWIGNGPRQNGIRTTEKKKNESKAVLKAHYVNRNTTGKINENAVNFIEKATTTKFYIKIQS